MSQAGECKGAVDWRDGEYMKKKKDRGQTGGKNVPGVVAFSGF